MTFMLIVGGGVGLVDWLDWKTVRDADVDAE